MRHKLYSSIFICLLSATPAALHAQTEDCNTNSRDVDSCALIVACIEETSDYFIGKAFGFESGRLGGELQDGTLCTGDWVARNSLGLGTVNIDCDNGVSADVIFTYQHRQTGTATGFGKTSDGRFVKVWAGKHIMKFLSMTTDQVDPKLICGSVEIPMS